MSFILISEALTIAVFLVFQQWVIRKGMKNRGLFNLTSVTIVSVVALVPVSLSHDALYLKLGTGLLTFTLWLLAYRFREQEPVAVAALVGLGAIVTLSG